MPAQVVVVVLVVVISSQGRLGIRVELHWMVAQCLYVDGINDALSSVILHPLSSKNINKSGYVGDYKQYIRLNIVLITRLP